MKDENRTRDERMNEVLELRQRVSELETLETERKRVEVELKRSNEFSRTALNAPDDAISVIDV